MPRPDSTPPQVTPGETGVSYAKHRPEGALIFQEMSALARRTGSANFAQGIPEAVYDSQWRRALAESLGKQHFQYVPSRGLPQLQDVIATQYGVDADNTVVTSGCTESLTASLLTLSQRGVNEVVVAEPFYSFYPGMAAYAGLPCRAVPMCDDGTYWSFPVDQLVDIMRQAHRAGKSCAVIVNSPHNPTGAVLTAQEWDALVAAAVDTGCWLLVDDAYRDFVFAGQLPNYQQLISSQRVIVAGSISKSLAAAGNRVGWTIGPNALLAQLDDAHMHQSYCVPGFMQLATAHVWTEVAVTELARVCRSYAERAQQLVATLDALGCQPRISSGGFFVTSTRPDKAPASHAGHELAAWLTTEYQVTPLPLDPFFATGEPSAWLRWSCTLPDSGHADALAQLS